MSTATETIVQFVQLKEMKMHTRAMRTKENRNIYFHKIINL